MKQSYLPQRYSLHRELDLTGDAKTSLFINIASVVIAMVLVMVGLSIHSLTFAFEEAGGLHSPISMVLEVAAYFVARELLRGLIMYLLGGVKPRFSFAGLYSHPSSEAYFTKGSYLLVLLGPVLFFGVVLAVCLPFLPAQWFWAVYLIQVVNLAMATSDLYVAWWVSRQPKDLLVQDADRVVAVYCSYED